MRRTLPKAPSAKMIATMSMPCLTAVEQLLDVVHEPAIARDRDDRQIGPPNLGSEGRRKAEAQGAIDSHCGYKSAGR